jgi:hypothetical protein
MKPERIEHLLREQSPTEPSFARPVPPLPHGVAERRVAIGRSVIGTSGAAVALVALVVVGLVGLRIGQSTPGPSATAGVRSASSAPSASTASGVIPWIDTRFVLPSVAPTEPVMDYALCPVRQSDLLAGGWGGATGSAAGGVVLINTSPNPCRIGAPSSVVLRDASGSVIARSPAPPDAAQVAIPSGGTASAVLVWMNWCHDPPAYPLTVDLMMTLEGDAGPVQTTLKAEVATWLTGSLTPRCDIPSSPSTVGTVEFSWDQRELGDYARKGCAAGDLRAFGSGWEGAAGTSYNSVVVYNNSSFDCDLPQPVPEIRDADGHAVVTGEGTTGSILGLPSGGTAIVELALANWCTPPPKLPATLDLKLGSQTLPVDVSKALDTPLPVDTCEVAPATPRPTFEVSAFTTPGFGVPEPPSDPGDDYGPYLQVAASLPASVLPGDELAYTVTLTNSSPYGKPFNLANFCPSYTEKLLPTGSAATVTQRYLLNCDPVGVLEGGQSRTFQMELAVPADTPVGKATLIWQLGKTGGAVKEGIWIGDPSSLPSAEPSSMSLDIEGAVRTAAVSAPVSCAVDSTGQLAVLPDPVPVAQGGFARVAVHVPETTGGHDATTLSGPDGWPGIAITVVDNPAGGAGGPTWSPRSGVVVLTIDDTSSGRVVSGSVEAKMTFWKNTEGLAPPADPSDVVLTARWTCPDDETAGASQGLAGSECSADQLRAEAVRQGENGVANIEVTLTNVGPSACWLPNVPTAIELVGAEGKPMLLEARPPAGEPGSNVTLPVSTSPTTSLIAFWGNWCASSPGPLSVVVKFDNSSGGLSAALPGPFLPRCDYPGQPSWIQIDSLAGS